MSSTPNRVMNAFTASRRERGCRHSHPTAAIVAIAPRGSSTALRANRPRTAPATLCTGT